MSDSLRPHELQHTRPPYTSPTPGVHSNSRPLCWWCHPAISSSVVPISFCPQSLPASESSPMSQLFAWGGQSTGVSSSLVAQRLKRLPAIRETWVRSLGWEDPLEKEMATYSSILAWKIPWAEKPGRLQSIESKEVRHDWASNISLYNWLLNILKFYHSIYCITFIVYVSPKQISLSYILIYISLLRKHNDNWV